MRIIVVGFGRVGRRTAEVLDAEGHEVVIVENDPARVKRGRDRGYEVVEGDGSDRAILEEAGVAETAAIGGMTGDIGVNHQVCLVGREFGCRTVMRVSEDVSDEVYESYLEDADDIVYPERLGAAGAKTALLGGDFNAIGDLTEGLSISILKVTEGAPIIDQHVNEVDLGSKGRIYAHGRDDEPLTIPLPGTIVESGDRLALLAEDDTLRDVRDELLGAD